MSSSTSITLRTAHRLIKRIQPLLNEPIHNIETLPVYDMQGDQDITNWVETKRRNLSSMLDERLKIGNHLFELRQMVAEANHASGIDALLNTRQSLITKSRVLHTFESLNSHSYSSPLSIRSVIETARRVRADETNTHPTIDVVLEHPTFSESIDSKTAAIRRKLDEVEDELATKNATNKIVLSEEMENFLLSKSLL